MRIVTLLVGISFGILPAVAASAASATFNFNTTKAPQNYFNSENLSNGQVLTPDLGDATQKGTVGITDPINPNSALQLEDGPSAGFGPGLVLESIQNSSSVFSLTFARPVFSVNFNFGVIYGGSAGFPAPPTDQNSFVASAFLNPTIVTPIATVSSGGGPYNLTYDQYFGHLSLSSVIGFSTVSFALNDTTLGDTFTLDDITADDTPIPVPEPGTIALGLALGMPALWRLRKGRRTRSK